MPYPQPCRGEKMIADQGKRQLRPVRGNDKAQSMRLRNVLSRSLFTRPLYRSSFSRRPVLRSVAVATAAVKAVLVHQRSTVFLVRVMAV